MRTLAAAVPLVGCTMAGGRRRVPMRCSMDGPDERRALFGRIVPVYDHVLDVFTLGQHRTWKRICVSWSMAKGGDRVLDLCCGTGDLALLASAKVGLDGEVVAVDFSRRQLEAAASRADRHWKPCYKNIKWTEGDALALPFADCYFDAVTVGYGLRNVLDRSIVMAEIFRVLKPGSRASILDFSERSLLIIENWVIDSLLANFAAGYGVAEEYKYLKRSISQYPTGEELEELAIQTGFASAKHYDLAGGLMGNLVAICQGMTTGPY
ncbi:2-phytyl-1,4-beta-naphthoquinone methyltransferase, chloroplastic-like isoform X1 [Miscanthus floridulus]|uniref:2-phytyl-1,4-beta-naphthoquinone methyltransferase, chloroplastic-like isoform X1 n=2 Tax=Miscanthus floridulus TaxID=154761 RepID=UPI0034598A9E